MSAFLLLLAKWVIPLFVTRFYNKFTVKPFLFQLTRFKLEWYSQKCELGSHSYLIMKGMLVHAR
ncbi:hypothetical protein YSY43_44090 [Paenibacillus sp. YSY-4.3]